ncbi:MAG: response regulator [candidate division Zixibacteria bacterium]|nr:response regulator [candidate division Zixibacteria bacterium]
MRRIIVSVLKKAGVNDISEVNNGQEALDVLKQDKDIGLVLLDWNMPVMTGIETLKHIRTTNKQLPVVMVTTESEKERVVEAIKAGANDYMLKPFNPDDVLEKLRKYLESGGK